MPPIFVPCATMGTDTRYPHSTQRPAMIME